MKISDKNNKVYKAACKREASFWEGTDTVYRNTPDLVKEYEQKNRYQSSEINDIQYFKSLGYFPKGLSIGSGLGTFEMMLLKVGIVGHFTFFDISRKANKALEEKAEKLGLSDKISTIEGDLNFLDLGGEKYDFISCLNVLHHIINLEECIQGLNSYMNESGIILIDECVGEQKMIWHPTKVDLVRSMRSYFKANDKFDIGDFVVTNWKVITNNCPFECVRSHELNNIIKYYFNDTKIIHSEFGHLFHLWGHFNYKDLGDKYFVLLEQYDAFVKANNILQPNRLFGVYGKSNKPLLDSGLPWNIKEIKHNIGTSIINEKIFITLSNKFLKNKYLYNICKKCYFFVRKFI